MSDNENNGGSPIDRSKRPRFEDEEWDSDYEHDGHEDRHPKRLAVPDPETKAPHFIPSAEETSNNNKEHVSEKSSSRRKKWEEQESEDDLDEKPRHPVSVKTEPSEQETDSAEVIAIRSLVGTKDAGVIIGRGGKNVSDIRELSSARVTISEIVPGAYERILTVSGPVHAVAKVIEVYKEREKEKWEH